MGADRDNLGSGVPDGAEAGTDNGGIALPPIYPIIDQGSLQLAAVIANVIVGVFFSLRTFADPQGTLDGAGIGGNCNLNDNSLMSAIAKSLMKYAGFYAVVVNAFAGWLALNYIASALTLVCLTNGYWVLFQIQNVYMNSFGYNDTVNSQMKNSGSFKGAFALRSILLVLGLYGAVTALNADPGHSFNA
jgi:hypothetical protein